MRAIHPDSDPANQIDALDDSQVLFHAAGSSASGW